MEKKEAKEIYGELFERAFETAVREAEKGDALLVMDEAIAACRHGFIGKERLLACLAERPERLEVVLTGRDPEEELLAAADYVSEIKKVKHPFDRGIHARRGIEY